MLHISPFFTAYCAVVAALLGACMASFLNCMAWRIVHGESVLRGRSHCDACGHVLGARDLVPVVSFLLSRGKCRYCGAKLSSRHVWGEVAGAAVFVSALFRYDISLQVLEAWALGCILLACAFADLEGYIIPDRFICCGAGLFALSLFFGGGVPHRLLSGALGGLAVPGGVLAVSVLLEKARGQEMLGGGDIKLLFVTGLFLGWQRNLLCLLLACVLGIAAGLASGRRETAIPWGPSIAAAAWAALLFGQQAVDWYLSLF